MNCRCAQTDSTASPPVTSTCIRGTITNKPRPRERQKIWQRLSSAETVNSFLWSNFNFLLDRKYLNTLAHTQYIVISIRNDSKVEILTRRRSISIMSQTGSKYRTQSVSFEMWNNLVLQVCNDLPPCQGRDPQEGQHQPWKHQVISGVDFSLKN